MQYIIIQQQSINNVNEMELNMIRNKKDSCWIEHIIYVPWFGLMTKLKADHQKVVGILKTKKDRVI